MSSAISYRKNYFKIYIWQALSILLGFASLFVVVPYLSSDKTLYGIYSVCTSLTIFFSYADLGFIPAGVKYAAEYFVQGDRKNEMRVIGFTAFVMVSAFLVVALAILVLALFPNLLIPDIVVGAESYKIAQALLLILAVSCPVIIGQRILSIVFTTRVEDYLFQRMMIVGNIARILSVLYFFRDGQYRVVEYYLFYQAVNLLVVIAGMLYTKKYGYKFADFLRTIRFDKEIFDKVKRISGTSLIMTICMILYYELDQIAISHWVGIEAVAIYGAALSVMTFVRTFSSLVFSPYTSRYNHFVGLNNMDGLSAFVNKMIRMFGVILVVPIATVSIFAKPFVISWIGPEYTESALLLTLMAFGFATNFIKEPICSYFVATERNQILLKSNCLLPLIYWLGIAVTIKFLGLESFAIFKFLAPTIVAIYYWKIAANDFKERRQQFVTLRESLSPVIWSLIVIGILGYIALPHMFYSHQKTSLLLNILIMGICLCATMVVGVLTNKTLKQEILAVINPIISKLRK